MKVGSCSWRVQTSEPLTSSSPLLQVERRKISHAENAEVVRNHLALSNVVPFSRRDGSMPARDGAPRDD
jgi:hypothetical protein